MNVYPIYKNYPSSCKLWGNLKRKFLSYCRGCCWGHEGSSLFKIVVNFTIRSSRIIRGLSLVGSGFVHNVIQDFAHLFRSNVVLATSLLFSHDEFISEFQHFVFKSFTTSLSGLIFFVHFFKIFVVDLISKELIRMLVVRNKFKISINLISKSTFTTVLDLIGEGFGSDGDKETGSKTHDKYFLELLITVEILFAMSGDVSVGLVHSQERVMVSSGSDGLGLLRVSGSGHVEGFGEMVVLPAGSGPEERFISDFIDHFDTNISLSLFFLVFPM